MTDPGDVTLASYVAGAQTYLDHSGEPPPTMIAYLDRFAELVGDGHVLELGSGPGWDATHLVSRGVRVTCSDANPVFVDRLRAAGQRVELLDIRTDMLPGPYDGVLADAVLLHLSRSQFDTVLRRIRLAVSPRGFVAFTLKEGDGEEWTIAKLGLPRHFTYWRESAVRIALEHSGWKVRSVDHFAGRTEPWLLIIAQAQTDD
jgi:SAM-dependent methyltransferase